MQQLHKLWRLADGLLTHTSFTVDAIANGWLYGRASLRIQPGSNGVRTAHSVSQDWASVGEWMLQGGYFSLCSCSRVLDCSAARKTLATVTHL